MSDNKISVVRTTDLPIGKNDMVTVYYSNNHMIITKNHNGTDIKYKKISDSQYLDTVSGKIKTINKSANNFRSIESLRKTFFKLETLIFLNFNGGNSEVFISLTYGRKKAEADCIGRDIKSFWARLNRFNKSQKLYRCLFLIEYQGNGHPHIHALLKRLDNERITLSKSELFSLWGNGYCDIQSVYDIDGLIEYLNPFHNNKKMKRLGYYKPYEKIFRCRGQFNRPQKLKMTCESAFKLAEVNNLIEYKSDSYEVVGADRLVNVITKKHFKIKKGNDNHENVKI